MTEYDNTNSGAVFPANNQKLIRQGTLNVEGKDENVAIVQTTTKTGKTVFEVYQKIGAVFINDRKRDEKDADMSGTVSFVMGDYTMWGRKRESKSGMSFTSLSIAPKNPPRDGGDGYGMERDDNPASKDFEDEIPF